MISISGPYTFEERWDALCQNLEDSIDRMNGSIVTKYFLCVNWSEQKNWQAFFKRLKAIDSFNGGFTWMYTFWDLFEDFDLFENEEFLVQYFNAIDPISSVTTDPKYAMYFAMHVSKAMVDSIADKIPKKVVDALNKYVEPFCWKN